MAAATGRRTGRVLARLAAIWILAAVHSLPAYADISARRTVEVPRRVIGGGRFYVWVTYRGVGGRTLPEDWRPAETLVLSTEPPARTISPSRLGPENYSRRFAFLVDSDHNGKLRIMLHDQRGRLAGSWIVDVEQDHGDSRPPNREFARKMAGPTVEMTRGLDGVLEAAASAGPGTGYLLVRVDDLSDYRVSTSVRSSRKWIDLYFPSASFLKPDVVQKADGIIGDILIDRSSRSGETLLSVEIMPILVGYNVTAVGNALILRVERDQ